MFSKSKRFLPLLLTTALFAAFSVFAPITSATQNTNSTVKKKAAVCAAQKAAIKKAKTPKQKKAAQVRYARCIKAYKDKQLKTQRETAIKKDLTGSMLSGYWIIGGEAQQELSFCKDNSLYWYMYGYAKTTFKKYYITILKFNSMTNYIVGVTENPLESGKGGFGQAVTRKGDKYFWSALEFAKYSDEGLIEVQRLPGSC